MMCERALSRRTKGTSLAEKQAVQHAIADSYIQLTQFRLLVLYTAWQIDRYNDYKRVRKDIAAIKVMTPQVLHDVVQRAIQIHGALGVTNELPLGRMSLIAAVLALADGPTEVHKDAVAKTVLKAYRPAPGLWPSEHLPPRIALARERIARQLEIEVAEL